MLEIRKSLPLVASSVIFTEVFPPHQVVLVVVANGVKTHEVELSTVMADADDGT